MNEKRLAVQQLGLVLFFNAALLITIVVVGGEALQSQWPVVVGAGLVFSIALWFTLHRLSPTVSMVPSSETAPREAPAEPFPVAAVQMLSILQRKGRLIDFLQEDIQHYNDAQIGAAVRTVHDGCRQALAEHVELESIFENAEGDTVTVESNFDAHQVRLTGNVSGDPPFEGTLRHRGWHVKNLNLPKLMQVSEDAMVIAPAEVEIP